MNNEHKNREIDAVKHILDAMAKAIDRYEKKADNMSRIMRVLGENEKLSKVIDSALNEIDSIVNEIWDNVDIDTDSKPTPYERGMYQACRRINKAMQEALESEEE